eukprot:2465157-Pyramimonas_sp.AAC.1
MSLSRIEGSRTTDRQAERYTFSQWTNQRMKRGYILTMDQSDAGSAGIYSQWTNQTQEARVYSHRDPRRGLVALKEDLKGVPEVARRNRHNPTSKR